MSTSPYLQELLSHESKGPCVSIYQPTHRQHPENQQDPIRFGNGVKQAAAALEAEPASADRDKMLVRLHELAEDEAFWNHTADGLAVFCSPGYFRTVSVQRPMPERVVVGDSFHVKPLLRIEQSADRFQVLAVGRRDARLFEGNRDALGEIAMAPEVPENKREVLGDAEYEPERQVHSYGTGPAASGAGSNRGGDGAKTGGMHHGHGNKSDVIDDQTEHFFRAVDRAVAEHHSKPSGLPLILAALPEHQAPFRTVSHNAHLVEAGIDVNPDALSADELRKRAWEVMEPSWRQHLADLADRYGAAQAAQQGSDKVQDVAVAAVAARIDTLLLEAGRMVPGRFDAATGDVSPARADVESVDDVLDDLAEQVLKTGGNVVVVPADRMPTSTGLAAIYRY